MISPLVEEIAELLYLSDIKAVPWSHAILEDRQYYARLADVVVDAVIDHLDAVDVQYTGAMSTAVAHLRAEADVARLRRDVVL